MRLPNQRSLALLKRNVRPAIWQISALLWLSLIFIGGCAGGTSGVPSLANLFGEASPNEIASPAPTATPVAISSPATEPKGHAGKKTAGQARAASENAALASKQAATASKQAPSVANRIEGKGATNNDVSLETDLASPAQTPNPSARTTLDAPASAASVAAPAIASVSHASPAVSTSAVESSGPSGEGDPATAAKLIQDIEKIEKRIDRKNLSADDSQRDILARKLLQEAKKALAERDNVAARSLATKASTLLAPLPKLASSAIPIAP